METTVTRVDRFGDYSTIQVPETETKSFYGMFLVFLGVLVCVAVLYGGAGLGNGLNLRDMAIASIVGSVILGVVGFLTALIGGRTRTSTYVIMRHSFGRTGSILAGVAVSGIGCGIGWFFIQAYLFGTVLETITNVILGYVPWIASAPISSVWGALMMCLTAYYGYKGIAFLSYIGVPLFLIVLGAGTFAAVTEAGGFAAAAAAVPANPMPMGTAITAVIGMYIAGATITSDISRFAVTPQAGAWAWFLQVSLIQPILMLAAGLMTLLTPLSDVVQAMAYLGMGLGALTLVVLGQWTTNDNNLYDGSLAFVNAVRIKRSKIVLIQGVIGAVFAGLTAAGFFGADPFMNFLSQLGRFLPPIAGVIMADYYIVRPYVLGIMDPYKRYEFGEGTVYPKWNWAGIVAWVLGALLSPYVPGAVGLNSILIGLVVYTILATVLEKSGITYKTGTYVEAADGF
jgi:cytosine permease